MTDDYKALAVLTIPGTTARMMEPEGVDHQDHGGDDDASPTSTSTPSSSHSDQQPSEHPQSEHPQPEEQPLTPEEMLRSIATLPEKPTKAMRSLIDLPVVRVPNLREGKKQDLAIRPVNHEAALAQSRGHEAPTACEHCQRQRGVWIGCVIVPGYFRGACANCHYMGQGTRCSLRPGKLHFSSSWECSVSECALY